MSETKTLKQQIHEFLKHKYPSMEIFALNTLADYYLTFFQEFGKEWLTQKPTIPKNLCNQFCYNACTICLLDDAVSKTELLEELKKG